MSERSGPNQPSISAARIMRASLPLKGEDWLGLAARMERSKAGDYDWRSGKLPLYVYWASEEAHEVSKRAYESFFVENGLARKAFPSVQELERNVIDMALGLLNAPSAAAGSFTTGGTESIFQAVHAARSYSRASGKTKRGRENIVVPRSAHPAFDKAARYLDIEVVRVPIGSDFRVDLAAVEGAINPGTLMIVGSAPCFPHGVFDDIAALGQCAARHDLWLHVDACVGGMLAPFLKRAGEVIPTFDFLVPEVASLSVDLHKYGYACKGASLVLYRSDELKRHQVFEFDNWPRGHYTTETFLGTRAGGPVASAWAVMNFLGEEGYLAAARSVIETKKQLIAGINAIGGLRVIEPNQLSFFLYESRDPALDINAVAERLGSLGWFVGRSVEPPAIHFMVNPIHEDFWKEYLDDLSRVVASVRRDGAVGRLDVNTY